MIVTTIVKAATIAFISTTILQIDQASAFTSHHRTARLLGDGDTSETRRGQTGLATWYGPGFHGRRTASGERFDAGAMTAAHRTLPFGTRVRVVHRATGRSVVVRINDRGPFKRGRVIDLSRGSAAALGVSGTAPVMLVRLD